MNDPENFALAEGIDLDLNNIPDSVVQALLSIASQMGLSVDGAKLPAPLKLWRKTFTLSGITGSGDWFADLGTPTFGSLITGGLKNFWANTTWNFDLDGWQVTMGDVTHAPAANLQFSGHITAGAGFVNPSSFAVEVWALGY